jgi:hypothetical protein
LEKNENDLNGRQLLLLLPLFYATKIEDGAHVALDVEFVYLLKSGKITQLHRSIPSHCGT